jgi:hypothetical protein
MMLGKLRLLSATGMLLAVTSAGALAADSLAPAGTYMGTPLTTAAPAVTTGNVTTGPVLNYAPPPTNSGTMTGPTEGTGTNPYVSGVGTSGHLPGR